MNGYEAEDMDKAWREYLTIREQHPLSRFGINPRKVFEAGWTAAKQGEENETVLSR